MGKKSQVWTVDLAAGITIFSIIIIIYFVFTSNISEQPTTGLNDIYKDTSVVSSTLLSAGYPLNWNITNIEKAGLTNGNYRLNQSKLTNMSSISYSKLKLLLKTKYDYLIFFESRNGNLLSFNGIEYIGKTGTTKINIKEKEKPKSITALKRFLIYNDNIITMVIYLWE